MSSTAIVIKQITEQLEIIHLQPDAIGILLFQDLAVIRFLFYAKLIRSNIHSFINQLGLAFKRNSDHCYYFIYWKRILKPIFYKWQALILLRYYAHNHNNCIVFVLEWLHM